MENKCFRERKNMAWVRNKDIDFTKTEVKEEVRNRWQMNFHLWAIHIILLSILRALNGAWQTIYPEVLKQRRQGFSTSSRGVQIWYDKLMRILQSQQCYGIKNHTLGDWVMEQTVLQLWNQVRLSVRHGKMVKLFWISFSL